MTKPEFIARYFEKANFESKAEAERKLNYLLETIEEVLLSGDEVNFIGWGKFEVIERAAREGRNPRTGETMNIPAKKAVKFKPGKKLNDKMN
jgi:DNA-binding protein HU-beta